jgi:hypothetical protein
MTSSLHIVVDAAAPELSELLLYARRVVCSKAASFEPGMLAMTAFGSTTTRNLLSEAGMAGYQGVHTLFELAPCCTAALDGLDALQALEGVESDIFDALVAAVYELHCKDKDGQRRREILVLCDAQRHADDDALEEDTAQLLKGIDDLGITISVVSTSPLPASGVLHTLFNFLGGGRFEFARLEGAGLHAQAGGIGPEPMERKEDDSKREAELEAEREVKKEAEPVEAKPDACEEEAGGSQCGALIDSNDDDVSVRSEVKSERQPMRLYLHLGASADKPIDLDADGSAAWDLQRRLTIDLTSEAIDFARLDKERNARHEAAQAAAGGKAVDVDTIDLLEGLREKLAEHVRQNGLPQQQHAGYHFISQGTDKRLKRQQRESSLPIWSNPKSAPGQPLYERFVAAWQRAPNQQILLVFHGTPEENIAAICTDGLDPKRRSGQAAGPGEYFGKQMAISQGYCRGGRHMLIFAVLLDQSGVTFQGDAFIVINKSENQLPLAVVTMSGEGYEPPRSFHTAVSNPHVERRVDPTDPGGGAFTRAEFIDFYGGTDEWDAAPSEKTVDLARRTLRAHLAWSQLDQERKILRSLAKNSADKGVREAMAAQFAHLGSTEAAVGGGGGGCDDEGDEGDGGGGGDAFADWDLRPGLGAPAPGPLPKGAAFLVTGALAPSDHAKARAHAAVAHAAAAAAQKTHAAARVEELKAGIAETEGAESEEAEGARVSMDEESAEEEPAKGVVLKPAEQVAAEEVDEEADAPEITVAAEAAPAAAVAAPPAARVAAEVTAAPQAPFGEADEFTLADAAAEVPQWARHLTLEEASAIASESRPPKRIVLALPGDAAAGSIDANDETGLSRLLDHELPFARILLFLSPEEATLLATGTCRGIRQHSAPLYNRYCRVFVRRLEAEARQSQRKAGSSRLVPPDALSRAHFPMDEPDGQPADGVASEVWAEVCAHGRSGLDCLRLLLLASDGLPDDH